MSAAVLLQSPPSHETRAVRKACMLLDGIEAFSADYSQVGQYRAQLASGRMMPVGSVEFVREAMRVAGLREPPPPGFPGCLAPWYCREIHRVRAGSVIGRWFVKPVRTKLFTGFVFDTMQDPAELPEVVRCEHDAFMALDADEEVWISEPVRFVSEWRYYIQEERVIGAARYDLDGDDAAPAPDQAVVRQAVAALASRTPCALDVGVLHGGETAVVEINSAWALGLYGHALSAQCYYRFLRDYWSQAVAHPSNGRPAGHRIASIP